MGKAIHTGRFMAKPGEDIVVFIIGMRINKWWAVHKWLPVFLAMPGMIQELYRNQQLGFLSMESMMGVRTTMMVQYWKSVEHLEAYAKGQTHLKAWGNFYAKVGNNSAVGIYHETYVITPGTYECFYGNMPLFGLAQAIGQQEVSSKHQTAKQRIAST
ncbi:DUF4188 domain-containing protein [Bacillus alkalicellulosilyticus]|uniref:DUF4188 domain-containing protein n=1 Tax=Alkalihalobacterium alkalicellulosilyticum TaxID=1912214 RepID=UPI000996D493|nr:DUF4188 domain-containing protein [Bacillus alkalicellulosilyticus]